MERWEFDPNNIAPYNFEPRLPSSSGGESGEGGSGGDTAGAAASMSPPAEPDTIGAVTMREWDENTNETTDRWRLEHFVWCRCGGKCRQMKTVRESVCCHDLVEAGKLGVGSKIHCLTEHPGFNSVVLSKDVLFCAMIAQWEIAQDRKADDDGYDDDDNYDDDVGNDDDDDEDEALGQEARGPKEMDNQAYRVHAYRQCATFLMIRNPHEERIRRVIPSCAVRAINETFPDPSGEFNFKGHYEEEGCM
ncbi:Hypp7379 [Branchiostoma lanceolatum]|uniref:Hypp7379 protein n=1 Tax=Branchiostoma lanceolatum TaxID=7740 RepID=A0A8J9Z011_BRALA|nr:Hypp7379 [Branchiostoma lanceolatum]